MSGQDPQKGMRCVGTFKIVECPCGMRREYKTKKTMDLFVKLHSKKCDRMKQGMSDENKIQGYVSRNVRLNRVINRYELGEGLVESNPRR